jgi:hypothetical protein
MVEIVLFIGCLMASIFSLTTGFIMLSNKWIEEDLYIPKFVKYMGIIGGFLTFFTCAYFLTKSQENQDCKTKYEEVTETFYRQVK